MIPVFVENIAYGGGFSSKGKNEQKIRTTRIPAEGTRRKRKSSEQSEETSINIVHAQPVKSQTCREFSLLPIAAFFPRRRPVVHHYQAACRDHRHRSSSYHRHRCPPPIYHHSDQAGFDRHRHHRGPGAIAIAAKTNKNERKGKQRSDVDEPLRGDKRKAEDSEKRERSRKGWEWERRKIGGRRFLPRSGTRTAPSVGVVLLKGEGKFTAGWEGWKFTTFAVDARLRDRGPRPFATLKLRRKSNNDAVRRGEKQLPLH